MESDTETQDPVEHRSSEYDAFNVNRPRGILTPEERQLFKVQSPFTAQQGMQDNGVDTDAFIETVIHSLLDFHLYRFHSMTPCSKRFLRTKITR